MRRVSAVLFSFIFLLSIICLPNDVAAVTYNDGFTVIGDVAIPFSEYMPGTFFTKNGSACTCHFSSVDCISSGADCNCLRRVTIDGKEVDLLAVQCIGFARYCFYRLFGFIDHKDLNGDKFYSAGSIAYGEVTAESVKELFALLKPGAHIRFRLSSTQHSVILLSKSDEGFTVYHCNDGGNGIAGAACIVSTKTYTWQSFASFAYRGIVFANMPNEYPDKLEYVTSNPTVGYSIGNYTITENLRLRDGAGTNFAQLAIIPTGTEVTVTEVSGKWGKVIFDGKEGWISLEYAEFTGTPAVVTDKLKPKEGSGITVEEGYVYGVPPKTTAEEFYAMFENETLSISSDQRYIGSGCIVSVVENGVNMGFATIIVGGDVNGDGIYSSGDYLVYKSILNGTREIDTILHITADLNNDGIITTIDYKLLQKAIKQQ